jgi:hypothetical protein
MYLDRAISREMIDRNEDRVAGTRCPASARRPEVEGYDTSTWDQGYQALRRLLDHGGVGVAQMRVAVALVRGALVGAQFGQVGLDVEDPCPVQASIRRLS